MIQFKKFTGGVFETNAYIVEAPEGTILIDAPQGISTELSGKRADLLVLTHGHFDHIEDAAAIKETQGCPVACHPDTIPMIEDADFFRNFGFQLEVRPVKADRLLEEAPSVNLLGLDFRILHVPGHCPGSICLLETSSNLLFGGDVLFRGTVGRWDLPGGNREELLEGIRTKIFTLPPETMVLSGHGPETTVGYEMETNPLFN